jgi:hypothetical protein
MYFKLQNLVKLVNRDFLIELIVQIKLIVSNKSDKKLIIYHKEIRHLCKKKADKLIRLSKNIETLNLIQMKNIKPLHKHFNVINTLKDSNKFKIMDFLLIRTIYLHQI